jgi:hypothetical protein
MNVRLLFSVLSLFVVTALSAQTNVAYQDSQVRFL